MKLVNCLYLLTAKNAVLAKMGVLCVLGLIAIVVAACGGAGLTPAEEIVYAATPMVGGREAERVTTAPTDTPKLDNVRLTQTVNPLNTHQAVTETLTVTMDDVVTQTPAAAEVCSPLREHPIRELPEIVSSPYDPPPAGKEQRHHGVDFSYYRRGERQSILGVGVQSVFTGRAAAAIAGSFPYGNFVIIETLYTSLPPLTQQQLDIQEGESLYLLYAHLEDAPLVSLGDRVAACQLIGTVGKSGNAGIPHLHLEARTGASGAVFGGMAYYLARTTQEERSNYELWRTSGEFIHLDPMMLFLGE